MSKSTWITKIKPGSHGSTPTQKRYWRVVSDSVRIRDWYKYKRCIACNNPIYNWQDSQAGHYRAWAVCRGYSKWDKLNIFGECAICNTGFNGNEIGAMFKEGIIKRYGQDRIEYINKLSSYPSEKMDDLVIEQKIINEIIEMEKLPEKPDYYYQIINDPTWKENFV